MKKGLLLLIFAIIGMLPVMADDNLDYLKATYELCLEEGVTGDAMTYAKTVIGGDYDADSDEVSTALSNLRYARYFNSIDTQENVYSGNTPAEGDFYIYNVGQKRFLCGGDDWGAHAALGFPGIIFTLSASGNGYIIDTHLYNGDGLEYLNYGGYCDTDTKSLWSFVQVSDGIYNIVRTDDTTYMLGYNTSYYDRVDTDFTDGSDTNNQWILVTKADRDALLSGATESSPVDATYLIKMPGFSQREYAEVGWDDVDAGGAWTHSEGTIWSRGSNYPDFVFECWNADPFYIYQNLTGLTAGYYKVTVQGYYRDGSRDDHASTVSTGGTPQQLAVLQLTGADSEVSSTTLVPIHQYADKAPGLGWDSEIAGEFPDACDQAYQYFWYGLYKNEAIVEVGSDGALEIRVTKSGGSSNDWVVLDNFRLTYYGTSVPTSIVLDALAEAIATAEALTGTSTDAINEGLAAALAAAKAMYENPTSGEDVVAATNTLNTWISLFNTTATNADYLIRTAALAEEEGLTGDALDNAKSVISTSTDSDEISSALESLRFARYLYAAETHDNVFSGNEPAEGDFYLYNVGQKRFFCGGDDWGAHAAVGYPGIILTLSSGSSGGYIINTHLYNGSGLEYLNDGGYCDTSTQTEWSFVSVGDGVYNIVRTADTSLMLGYNTSYYARVDTDFTDGSDTNNQWILVTKDDRDALLDEATEINPIDASHLIKMPGFSQREYAEVGWSDVDAGGAWTITNGSIYGRGDNYEDFVFECWNADPLDIYQTITDLEPGYYKVSVQGYYRDGAREVHAATVDADGTPQQLASLIATPSDNDAASTLLVPIHKYSDYAPGLGWESGTAAGEFPDACTQAYKFFWLGYYKNEVTVQVGDEGTLKIEVTKSGGSDYDWVVLDNFRLVYYGSSVPVAEVIEALADAIALAEALSGSSTDAINTGLAEALAAAKELYENPTTSDEVLAATNTLSNWVTLFNNTKANATYLRATAALAEEEGLESDALDTANYVIVYSIDSDEISSALESLRFARNLYAAETHDNVFSGNEPAAGEVYLYNVGQKRFLCGGDDWGTHASVGFPGHLFTLVSGSNGGYIIDTQLQNGSGEHYLNYGGYVDTGTQSEWSFSEVSDGVYNIVRTEDTQYMLGYNTSYYARVDTDMSDASDENNQWIIVTKDDRDALLADASDDNPVDASYLIKMPNFNQRDYEITGGWDDESTGAWIHSNGSIYGRGDNYEDFVFECWNADPLEIYQTLSDLPEGKYTVTVQGYYRDGAREVHAATVDAGETPQQLASLKLTATDADEVSTTLVPIHEYADMAPGLGWDSETAAGEFPDACTQAYKFFWLGYYKNEATIEVADDGALEIRVSKSGGDDYDWVVLDNFRLTYYGTGVTTAIEGVTDETAETGDGKTYTLQGIEINNPQQRGVYIKNGKKFVVK